MATKVGEIELEVTLNGRALKTTATALGRAAGTAFRNAFNTAARGRKGTGLTSMLTQIREEIDRLNDVLARSARTVHHTRQAWRRYGNDALGSNEALTKSIRNIEGALVGNRNELERNRDAISRLDFQNEKLNSSMARLYSQLSDNEKRWIDNSKAMSDNERIRGLNRASIDRLNASLREQGAEFDKTKGKLVDIEKSSDRTSRYLGVMNNRFAKGNLLQRAMRSHVGRTILAWSALIAIIGQGTAVLGSGVGSSLTQLVTILGAGAAAAGVMIVAFQGMFDAEKEVVAAAQPAKAAIQDLIGGFKELQGTIQGAFFQNSANSINRLSDAITNRLSGAIENFSTMAGDAFNQFLDGLSGDRAVQQMQDLLNGFGPILTHLVGLIQNLGGALSDVLIYSLPFAKDLAASIEDLFGRFSEWTASEEGRQAITQWFENSKLIMGPVIELAGALGKMLADLVTPESIELFRGFVQGLIDFMPHARALFNIIGELRILELLTTILNALGEAFGEAGDPLTDFASALGDSLISLVKALTPLMKPLAAIIGTLAKAFGQALEAVMPFVESLLESLTPILETLAEQFDEHIDRLMPILIEMFNKLAPIVLRVVEAVAPLAEKLFPILSDLAIVLAEAFLQVVDALLPFIEPLIEIGVQILNWVVDLLPPLVNLLQAILPVAIDATLVAFEFLIPIMNNVLKVMDNFKPFVDALIDTLGSLIEFITAVFTGDWEKAWKSLGKVFENVWKGIVGFFEGVVNSFIDGINMIIDGINSIGGNLQKLQKVDWTGRNNAGRIGGGGGTIIRPLASGGILTSPTFMPLAGEAGAEAVVPLTQPLSQVDPSVRALAAFAQGKAGGVNIEAGAITVVSNSSTEAVARAVLDQMVDRIAS